MLQGLVFLQKKNPKNKKPQKLNKQHHPQNQPKTEYQKAPNPFTLTCVPSDVQQMDIYSNPLLQKSAEELFACSKTSHALFSS